MDGDRLLPLLRYNILFPSSTRKNNIEIRKQEKMGKKNIGTKQDFLSIINRKKKANMQNFIRKVSTIADKNINKIKHKLYLIFLKFVKQSSMLNMIQSHRVKTIPVHKKMVTASVLGL